METPHRLWIKILHHIGIKCALQNAQIGDGLHLGSALEEAFHKSCTECTFGTSVELPSHCVRCIHWHSCHISHPHPRFYLFIYLFYNPIFKAFSGCQSLGTVKSTSDCVGLDSLVVLS